MKQLYILFYCIAALILPAAAQDDVQYRVILIGDAPLWRGVRPQTAITGAVKEALDPQTRFPSLDD